MSTHRDDEAWYVISGALRFHLADREVIAPAGSTVLVPAGVAHTFGNAGPGPSRYLILLTATLDSLITELHQVDATEHPRIYRKYNSEVLEYPGSCQPSDTRPSVRAQGEVGTLWPSGG